MDVINTADTPYTKIFLKGHKSKYEICEQVVCSEKQNQSMKCHTSKQENKTNMANFDFLIDIVQQVCLRHVI